MKYDVTITTLSPLHIGTGTELLRDYDFRCDKGRTWMLNQEAILAAEYEEETGKGPIRWQRLKTPAGQLLSADELKPDSPFVRYVLEDEPQGNVIREQIKDAFGRVYIPGSSLKGALRTVLMMAYAVGQGFRFSEENLNNSREWAAQRWERAIFGSDPNHDLMRALHVVDSEPLPASQTLVLIRAEVMGGTKPGAPINVEAIKPDVSFRTSLLVDDYLFSSAAASLDFQRQKDRLDRLVKEARTWATDLLEKEIAFAKERPSLSQALNLYNQMLSSPLPPGAFFLQLGWGAGWQAKTVGPWLPPPMQRSVRERYQLGRPPKASRDWKPNSNTPFPKSRRASKCYGPFGWVLVKMKKLL